MRTAQMMTGRWISLGILSVIANLLLLSLGRLEAQVAAPQGDNAVYSGVSQVSGSAAFIDAKFNSGTDLCQKINNILLSNPNPYPTTGAIIDARGVNPGASQSCAASPWVNPPSGGWPPAVILLPAGTITIPGTWLLPNRTRIVGERASGSGQNGTVLFAGSNFSPMIKFGDSSAGSNCGPNNCFGIDVEDLTLNGNSQNITGILNDYSQELTYVSHVTLYQIEGTGLQIGDTLTSAASAQNSGPYSDIKFDTGTVTAKILSTTKCAQIYGPGTRGIHGLTCVSNGTPTTGVSLEASDNSLEDIHISGFKTDGISIGSTMCSFSNVIFNVTGSTSMTNLVHINTPTQTCSPNQNAQLVIMQLTSNGAVNTVTDDLSSPSNPVTDPTLALYGLGQAAFSGAGNVVYGYSRFTTSTSTAVPTWLVGSTTNLVTGGCTPNGTLLSNTMNNTNGTLYLCANSGWVKIQ